MFGSLIAFIALVAVLYAWQNALKARDLARARCHALCERAGVQLLDQTVTLSGLAIARNGQGRLCLRRRYAFEVSLDGHDRHRGGMQMLDGRVFDWSLPITQADIAPANSNVIDFASSRPPRRLH